MVACTNAPSSNILHNSGMFVAIDEFTADTSAKVLTIN